MVRREDTDFMGDLHAAMRGRPRVLGNLLLIGIVGFFIAIVWWASWAEIDERTSGQGQVIPSSQVQVVQNLEGGILAALHVAEGEAVVEGQLLMRLDNTQFIAKSREDRAKLYALNAVIARASAEIDGTSLSFSQEVLDNVPAVARTEAALYRSRARELAATIEVFNQQIVQGEQELIELDTRVRQLERSLELIEEELDITRPMVDKGVMPRVDLIRLEREHNEIKGTLDASRQMAPRLDAALSEIQGKIREARANFKSAALKELNEAQVNLNALQESLASVDDRVRRTEILAPVAGIIKQVLINTIGGVVRPGMDLVEIVPLDDKLLIEARIRPADIAFLHPGQEATVKITAYDYTIFGTLPAELVYISADTILDEKQESYYLIRVRTERNDLGNEEKTLPIIPGMTAEVDVLTGKRTVLEYLLKPILRGREMAFRER